MTQGTELAGNEAPVENNNINHVWQHNTDTTFHHGNLPTVATATVTAGLICPPDTPPLTTMPSITPIPHLGRTRGHAVHVKCEAIPPVNREEVPSIVKGED